MNSSGKPTKPPNPEIAMSVAWPRVFGRATPANTAIGAVTSAASTVRRMPTVRASTAVTAILVTTGVAPQMRIAAPAAA